MMLLSLDWFSFREKTKTSLEWHILKVDAICSVIDDNIIDTSFGTEFPMKVSYKTGGSKPRPGVNRSYDDPNASHDSQRPFNYDSDYVNEVPQPESQQPAADVTTGATDTDKKTSKKKSKKVDRIKWRLILPVH